MARVLAASVSLWIALAAPGQLTLGQEPAPEFAPPGPVAERRGGSPVERTLDDLISDVIIFQGSSRGRGDRDSREGSPLDPTSDLPVNRLLGLERSRVRIHGWIQNSFTGNPASPANGHNFGVNPNDLANQWMGNQYYLIVEDPIEQGEGLNFGFRFDNLFGNDWQFNHMHGLFDDTFQLNRFAGYDPAQFYAEVHLPVLTEGGLDIRGGRWYTIAGYEGVPAVSRPLLSVPYMFDYGQPFTHFGVLTTLYVSDRVKLFNGAINGWDRFVNDHYDWGYVGGFSWDSPDGRSHLAFTCLWGPNQFPRFLPAHTQIFPTGYVNIPSLAGLPNPGYRRNDRTLFTTVMTRNWTDRLLQVLEFDQGWERSIPGLGSAGRNGLPASDQWYAVGNWFLLELTEPVSLVLRTEWFRNVAGSRTGFPGDFFEVTFGAVLKPSRRLWIRPEVRYDWAHPSRPYDNGTSGDQLTIGLDMILIF
ncbi:outer membrane beta-barrel protein [Tautonia marina]|uniref:outer membrane beta-barrel protein n=1 Tax=Tautonia marina TaxID=2653855 RepID=UPI0012611AF2|nr:outer membrane beta-barrel protein [Tautonia marina]